MNHSHQSVGPKFVRGMALGGAYKAFGGKKNERMKKGLRETKGGGGETGEGYVKFNGKGLARAPELIHLAFQGVSEVRKIS